MAIGNENMIELPQTLEDSETMEHLKTNIAIIGAAYLFSIHPEARVGELAEMLNISERTLYRWAKTQTWDQTLSSLNFTGTRTLRKQNARDVRRENPDPHLIDLALVKNCATQFAQIATRDDFIELSELDGIHPTLIDQDADYAMVSDFGKWIWDNLRSNILSSRILELPRLTYSNVSLINN